MRVNAASYSLCLAHYTLSNAKLLILAYNIKYLDSMGIAIKTTFDQNKTIEYGSLINQFKERAIASIKAIHPDEEVLFIRIRSEKNEIMIAPDEEFSLIIVQNPSGE